MQLNKFELTVNLNVQINDSFQCESKKNIGTVNTQQSITVLIPEGDFKTQNSFLKKELKKMKFNFNDVSDPFKFTEISCIDYAKSEIKEILNLKNPLNYIHNRRKISIFKTNTFN